jgi:hypothetical protein
MDRSPGGPIRSNLSASPILMMTGSRRRLTVPSMGLLTRLFRSPAPPTRTAPPGRPATPRRPAPVEREWIRSPSPFHVPYTWLQLPALRAAGWIVDVVGESFYQDAIEEVSGGRTGDGAAVPLVTAQLEPGAGRARGGPADGGQCGDDGVVVGCIVDRQDERTVRVGWTSRRIPKLPLSRTPRCHPPVNQARQVVVETLPPNGRIGLPCGHIAAGRPGPLRPTATPRSGRPARADVDPHGVRGACTFSSPVIAEHGQVLDPIGVTEQRRQMLRGQMVGTLSQTGCRAPGPSSRRRVRPSSSRGRRSSRCT